MFSEHYFFTITDIAGHASHRRCNMWRNAVNYPRSTLTITYLMSSLDKAVIVDNEKVLILPIITLPIFTSTLMLSCLFAHMLKARRKNTETLIVTNGNGFCQEK
jgi:hypothetical protein